MWILIDQTELSHKFCMCSMIKLPIFLGSNSHESRISRHDASDLKMPKPEVEALMPCACKLTHCMPPSQFRYWQYFLLLQMSRVD